MFNTIEIFGVNKEIYEKLRNELKEETIDIIYGRENRTIEIEYMTPELWSTGKVKLEIRNTHSTFIFHDVVSFLSEYACYIRQCHLKSTSYGYFGEYYNQ